jgi:hypothetical protein
MQLLIGGGLFMNIISFDFEEAIEILVRCIESLVLMTKVLLRELGLPWSAK